MHRHPGGLNDVAFSTPTAQFEALDVVRAALVEGKRMGSVDFFIGDGSGGSDGIEWYGMYGPACEGTADDIIAYEKKLRWFQLLKDFNCTVTSTWTNNEDSREFHTWRAWDHGVVRSSLTISWAQRTCPL